VVVRVPKQATRLQIDALLMDKAGWIEKKLAEQKAAHPELQLKKYEEGERFDYLGQSYPLQLVERATRSLELRGGSFHLRREDQSRAVQIFEAWYRTEARAILSERVNRFAGQHGFAYRGIRISGARTRWGSCSSRGGLNFTWRLMLAPLPVIDYVVVHELAHLKIPNHSKAFWKLVEDLMPGFAEQRAWLKAHGRRLSI
jgi:predicted metal-dependent hydrolase